MKYILIALKEQSASAALKDYLQGEDFTVIEAKSTEEALRTAEEFSIDVAILDVEIFGLDICERIREIQGKTLLPCILISEKEADCDKMKKVVIAANHFLVRPVLHEEILSCIQESFRLHLEAEEHKKNAATVKLRDITLSLAENRLCIGGEKVHITRMEYRIFRQLVMAPGRIFSKAELYENIFGICFQSDENTVMVHISNLRGEFSRIPENPNTYRRCAVKAM